MEAKFPESKPFDPSEPDTGRLFTAEQVRQAVLEERERCAETAEDMLGCEADQIAVAIRKGTP